MDDFHNFGDDEEIMIFVLEIERKSWGYYYYYAVDIAGILQ